MLLPVYSRTCLGVVVGLRCQIRGPVDAQYDWMTGVPDNGNERRKFRVVPRLHPLRSLVLYFV